MKLRIIAISFRQDILTGFSALVEAFNRRRDWNSGEKGWLPMS